MAASILSIGTAVPPARASQTVARDVFASQPGLSRIAQRLIRAAFDASAIDHRNTVLADLVASATGVENPDPALGVSLAGPDGTILAASTGARNDAYILLAPALFAAAAAQALAEAGVAPDEVTHVVTVSCTGMFAPGPDFRLVKDLGLRRDVERYHIGFMGCAAALPGLRAASRICAAQPDAVVLVAAAELCTLHIRSSEDPQQIVAASVFADGAAAAVVAQRPRRAGPRLEFERFGTVLTSEGESDMVWTIGDEGFNMILTAEVPRIIGREIRDAVESFLGADVPHLWAVHPGGRSVLDRVESGLNLDPSALEASRSVLRRQGNMSSATILFILRDLLHDENLPDDARVAALAFGPGLTVESALLTRTTTGPV
ncbi:type III polyketide synthase [Microbacterium sp. P5_E9]